MNFRVRQLVYELIVMSCAGDRGNAATFGGSTPSVTSWWAGARTAKEEKREGENWFFEKNRRVVLKMHDEHGRCRYWRAPRPRPRPHRRQIRRRRQQIVKAALSYENSPSTTPAQDVIQVLQASLRNSLRRAEAAEKALQLARERITGEDQPRQLRDQHAARPPVEPDLHACSVQQGVDPTAPQATQAVTRLRPVFTHTGPERKQPPPPPKAHFALDHRSAVWSPFRTGGALQAPTEETDADRQEETGDSAATAHCWLQNSVQNSRLNRRLRRLNSAISDFRARGCKIESKLQRLTDGDMNDEKQERRL